MYSFLEMGSYELGPVRDQAKEMVIQLEALMKKAAIGPEEDPPRDDG